MGDALNRAKNLVRENNQAEALTLLRAAMTADTDFTALARAARWARTVEWKGLRPLRVAYAGGGTLDHLIDFIGFWLLLRGFRAEAYLPPYGTWKMEILNPDSGLYRFRPDIVWLFTHWRDLDAHDNAFFGTGDVVPEEERMIRGLSGLWRMLARRLPAAQILQNNCDPAPHEAFGNFAAMLPESRTSRLRRINILLPRAAAEERILVFDLDRLAARQGLERWHSPSYWFHSKHPFAPELSGWVGYHCAKTLAALKGTAKKVLVLDLDNTLWGGVIGDDGLEGIRLGMGADGEAYAAFQEYVLELSRRGVVLAVASKNEDAAAREPFLKHPDMRLRLDDIAVFTANWRNKADNIRDIAATLNLGMDAFVFVDDNPAERDLVRRELPMVAVPEMPAEPAEYIRALENYAYFETVSHSAEDAKRGQMYRENARRAEVRSSATSLDEYLASLEMVADSGPADEFHLPRMAQLVNKSNQFNLTGARRTEAELRELAARDDHLIRWFSLRDRFGDYGLISVVVLRRDGDAFVIDAWVMSCRVLERGMERFILREIAGLVRSAGAGILIGRYFPTAKNTLVANLYAGLGFSGAGDTEWTLTDLDCRNGMTVFIEQADKGM